MVCVRRTRPAHRLKSLPFAGNNKNEEYVRVMFMRHRNKTGGWHVCAGCVKHVVDLDLTVARTGRHDDGAGREADAPGGSEVGEYAPEGITIKYHSCSEELRQNAEMVGKARRLRRYRS